MRGRSWLLIPVAVVSVVLGGGWPLPAPAGGQAPARRAERIILSLGSDQFIPKAAIEAETAARFQSDFRGLRFLDDVSVIVLADIPYAQLPAVLQSSLGQWVELGGSLLITGGNSGFGLGGYAQTPVGEIFPLRPAAVDRVAHGFSPTYIVREGHPTFAGVTTTTMANFNETTVAADATLILEYRGASKGGAAGGGLTGAGTPFGTTGAGVPGGVGQGGIPNTIVGTINTQGGIQGGGRPIFPLIAERQQGRGTILAIALDMNGTGEWGDREKFTVNALRYLLDRSKLP